jgi:alginate O-acetyltransferase complex protein AlgI
MQFTSLTFLVAFPLFCALFFVTAARHQPTLLLLGSIVVSATYGWASCTWLVAVTLIGFFLGIALGRVRSALRLTVAVVAVIAPLLILKYTNFAMTSAQAALAWFGVQVELPHLDAALPVGISFYTFSVVGYLIDVYIERTGPEPRLLRFALFTSFFPKFVAGPVERTEGFLPQIDTAKRFDYTRVTDGIRIMAGGLLKKVVIADRIAPLVDGVYRSPHDYGGLVLVLTSVFYMFQLYYDFSGYSEMAVGAGRILGYDLTWNFNRPYAARSITEYWRRWHISLTSWFFEYIFAPVAGALRHWKHGMVIMALMATFLVSGLWHGAQWTFVLYGAAHGTAMSLEYLTASARKRIRVWLPARLYAFLGWALTFSFVAGADVLFRSRSIDDAGTVLHNMFGGIRPDLHFLAERHFNMVSVRTLFSGLPVLRVELVIAAAAIACVEFAGFIGKRQPLRQQLLAQPVWLRWSVYYASAAAILYYGSQNAATAFVYGQF